MNFNQYECGGGKAVPVNPFPEYIEDSYNDHWKNHYWLEFDDWLQSQPAIHCDPELSGVYPVGEFEEINYQWFDEPINDWRTNLDITDHNRSIYNGYKTRLYIEYTGAKQPVSEPDEFKPPGYYRCSDCDKEWQATDSLNRECPDCGAESGFHPKPAIPEQKQYQYKCLSCDHEYIGTAIQDCPKCFSKDVWVTPEQKGVEQEREKMYHVCHACQKQGLRHCNEADKCESVKQYPKSLRDMVEIEFKNKTPLSIIAEMAFDLGKSLK